MTTKDPTQLAERVLECVRLENGRRIILRSELVPLAEAGEDCRNDCGHIGIGDDDRGLFYDTRVCLVCGASLGSV